jgi:predicted ABC-class ATPase
LIDEDTCATNFMVRDSKMIQLVAPDKEPITPFVRVIRSLYDDFGCSSVLVVGGVGDFFRPSDNVLVMDCYKCLDATERAKQIVATSTDEEVTDSSFHKGSSRTVKSNVIAPNGKVKVQSMTSISYGETELDVSGLEQLVAKSQTAAIANSLQRLGTFGSDGLAMKEILSEMDKRIDSEGLDVLTPGLFHGGMSRPRMLEVAGALNRLRRQSISQLR